MAESKKPSSGTKKSAHETRNEAAEALRQAAELIASLNSEAQAETTTKKPAAKKPAAKKPAAKSGTSKTPAKKPTTKKPATKAAPKAESVEEPAETEPQKKFGNRRSDCKNCGAENDKFALVCHACGAQLPPLPEGMVPPEQPAPVAEQKVEQPTPQPVVEQKAEEPAPQPVVEQKAEEPAPAPVVEQKAEEPVPQPAPAPASAKKTSAFASKSNTIINKIKFPLWIVANALLLLSSIFLMIGSFNLSYRVNGVQRTVSCSLFQYLGNAEVLKGIWQGTAGEWANGGYAMVGIFMFLSFLVPLALIVKNVVFFIIKKDKEVHMLDAIVTFAFLLTYLGVYNMYGANVTWAHVISFIVAIVLIAYTIFVILIENTDGPFPFFSIANIVLIVLCVFLMTTNKIYAAAGWYAAHAAAFSGGGGFAFIMLLIALAALILLLVMQVKKLPGKIAWLFEFIVPAVAGVFALIALIAFVAGKPTGLSMGGGFVFGAILTLLFAAADVVFALVPKLHKFNVKITDRMPSAKAPVAAQPVAATQPATTATEQPVAETKAETAEQPAPQPAPEQATQTVKCSCGKDNDPNAVFCRYCGRKLK